MDCDGDGGSFANSAGGFSGSCTSTLDGKYATIIDSCGSIYLTDSAGDLDFGMSGGWDCVTPGFGGAGNTHAARTQYYNVTLIKMKAISYYPSGSQYTWLSNKLTDRVNLTTEVCNAYWGSGMLNFMRSGSGCANTGELPGVSLHEWGHGFDSNDGMPPADNGTGETYGDFTAVLQTHDSCTGNGFTGSYSGGYGDACVSCTGVRDIDYMKRESGSPHFGRDMTSDVCVGCTNWACEADNTYAGPCGGEGHCESYVSSEALWDLAARDLIDWGMDEASAWQLVDRLWYASRSTATAAYTCNSKIKPSFSVTSTSGCFPGTLWRVFRTVDDDNGDTSDGTPHSSALWAAFNRHEIGCSSDLGYNTDYSTCNVTGTPVLHVTDTDGQAMLNWTSVANAVSYHVYRNEAGCDRGFTRVATVTAPTTAYTDTPLVNGIYYYYRIQAVGSTNACVGPMSNCDIAAPLACTPPSAPTGMDAADNGDYRIDVSWNSVGGATQYAVYRSTASGGPYDLIGTVSSAATSYADTDVYGTETYYYVVTAFNGCESVYSTEVNDTAGGTCDIPPTFAGVATVQDAYQSGCRIDLGWSAGSSNCSGTISYEVYRSETQTFTPGAGFLIGTTSGTSYQDTGVAYNKRYYYAVRAVDSVNGLDDGNSIVKSAFPTGNPALAFDFEGGDPYSAGWVNGPDTASTGTFVWGDPDGTINNNGTAGQPEDAVSPVNCLFTATNEGGAGVNDIDGGEVRVTSPTFDCSSSSSCELNVYRWWLNDRDDGGGYSGDYYYMEVSNNGGSGWTTLESFDDSCTSENDCNGTTPTNQWNNVSYLLQSYVSLTNNMKVRWRAADQTGDLVECAVDDVYVYTPCTTCTPPADPTGLTAAAGANQVALTWSGSGTTYNIYRSDGACPGGTFTQIDGNVGSTSYTDTTVSAGAAYSYKVTALSADYCESGYSACVDATPTGTCFLAPSFGGLTTIANTHNATCGIGLGWTAATANCGGSVTYNVYRSTASGFTPSISNQIASGITGITYTDSLNLVHDTVYYYVVRALENGVADANLVELSSAVSGTVQVTPLFSDNMDSGTWTDKWESGFFVLKTDPETSMADIRGYQACNPRSGANSFRWGGSTCTGNYQTAVNSYFNPTNGIYGLYIPNDATTASLSFWHRWNFPSDSTDGALLFCNTVPSSMLYYYGTDIIQSGQGYNGLCTGNGLVAADCWTGDQNTYVNSVIDLEEICSGSCAGKTLTVGFGATSNASGTDYGWFIDDVELITTYGAACTTAGCQLLVEVTPSSETVGENEDIVFTVSHSLTKGPYTYQWTEDGGDISGATGTTLAVNKATAQTHTYNCEVTDSSGYCTGVTAATGATGTWGSTSSPPEKVPYSTTPMEITSPDGGANGTVTWDATNCPSADYHLVWGYGSNLSSYTVSGSLCNMGDDGTEPWNSIPDPSGDSSKFLWFIVLGNDDSTTEGSWGVDSDDAERNGAEDSGVCGITTKDTFSGTCGID